MNETQWKKSLGHIRESRANCGLPNPPLPNEVAGAEEEPQDIHRSPPLHAPPPISVPPLPHWSMSYEEYRNMQASHEHLCRRINAYELTSTRNHYDLVSMFRVFTSQEPLPPFAPPFEEPFLLPNPEEWFRLGHGSRFKCHGAVGSYLHMFVFPAYKLGEANFLGGVASVKGVEGFNPEAAKKRFFEIYLDKYEEPNSGIGFPGALELITQAMQYASPKSVWNLLFGVSNSPSFGQNEGVDICRSCSARVQQFVNYISDLETRGTASIVPEFPSKLDWLNMAPLKLNRVVNDGDVFLWRELGVNSWPTFVIVGPNGKLLAQISGEGRQKVVTDLDGNFIIQIGSTGEKGFHDGSFEDAAFNRPHGLAYDAKKNLLFGVDTENRALRVINFVDEMAGTLAGNGTKACYWIISVEKKNISLLLNSPWDVCFDPVNKIVYIAMAGQHQIWEHNTLDGDNSFQWQWL
ncbi:hypothetical protein RHGRI_029927 [Rhododendron griersonianum]|uniref:Uncharacterized protein n=1 Tax=Rhododendron griersonianum TaxID=479676 RepID=A0AAV6IPQ5_9ERIC|nr:hypothetical protein RHGRI_029927 [Rhododendron griersonianum]